MILNGTKLNALVFVVHDQLPRGLPNVYAARHLTSSVTVWPLAQQQEKANTCLTMATEVLDG